jgi:hypothetical protein
MRLLFATLIAVGGLAAAQPALADGGLDPGRAAQSLCKGPLGEKLGADCVGRLTSLIGSCLAQSSSPDAVKACVQAQLPAPQQGAERKKSDLAAIVAACKAQLGSGDAWKACVKAKLGGATPGAQK